MKINRIQIVDGWVDSLIWCPSQCSLNFRYENKCYQIYLRWRHDDPWTATLIECNEKFEDKGDGFSAWTDLEIPFFTQYDRLDDIKDEAMREAINVL